MTQKRERAGQGNGRGKLSEVARLYYAENFTQERIARRMGISRSYVSRMLRDARSQGLVEIKIHVPLQTVEDLEHELVARFGLREARVLASTEDNLGSSGEADSAGVAGAMAAFTARYMQEAITDNSIVGSGWSRTIYRSVNTGYLQEKTGVTVVQLMGSLGSHIPELNDVSVATRLADALGADLHYLHAPMLVDDALVRDGLLRDPNIQRTLEIAGRADIMVVGVGAIDRDHGQYRTGYIDDADLEYIRENGVVGDVCGVYFSYDGSLVPLGMNGRTVAVGPEVMKDIPKRVGVSRGQEKAVPNIGAVRSGLINVLITDEPTARKMLELLDEDSEAVSEDGTA